MIIALQTAGPTTFMYAFDKQDHELMTCTWESGRELSDNLLDKLKKFLTDCGTDITGLTGIIIYSGPGSFTSLRIGHTVVNALAAHLKIPVVGASGDNWRIEGLKAVPHAPIGVIAMPFYGAEANVTRSKA